jgi:hypothetical protein
MNMHNHICKVSLAAAIGLGLGAAGAHAASVNVPLGGNITGYYQLHQGADILNYFNGGSDSVPNDGTGPSLGIQFSSNATAQLPGNNAATGDGKFENVPSGSNEVVYFGFSNSTAAYVNYAAGFTGFNVNYSYSNNSGVAGEAYLFSGLNGTGSLLGTINLAPATTNIKSCSVGTDAYCTWQSTSLAASSLAESVVFGVPGLTSGGTSTGAPVEDMEFDGLQFTGANPVPLPASVWLMLSGFAGLAGIARRRRPAAV